MFIDAPNFYRMTTATSVPNSGTGSNALAKPAGVESASILPDKKYSVYIGSSASFTTNFDLTPGTMSVYMYCKPNPGTVIDAANNSVVYTGYSYKINNDIGQVVEVSADPAAHFVVMTISDQHVSLFVDGRGGVIEANTLTSTGPSNVSVLSAGGILDMVSAQQTPLSTTEMNNIVSKYLSIIEPPNESGHMFDEFRNFDVSRTLIDKLELKPGESKEYGLRSNECLSFKVEYDAVGSVGVSVNDVPVKSGYTTTDDPVSLIVGSENGGVITNLVITEYYSENMFGIGSASISTNLSSGKKSPTHTMNNLAANSGSTTVTLNSTANTIAGWFRNTAGSPLPGVTSNGSSLTGTGLYVNGKPYTSGSAIGGDWYFLTKTGATTGTFTVDVPVHAMTVSTTTMNDSQIDDLYESFYGNPVMTVAADSINISEQQALVVSTEWDIVSSG